METPVFSFIKLFILHPHISHLHISYLHILYLHLHSCILAAFTHPLRIVALDGGSKVRYIHVSRQGCGPRLRSRDLAPIPIVKISGHAQSFPVMFIALDIFHFTRIYSVTAFFLSANLMTSMIINRFD